MKLKLLSLLLVLIMGLSMLASCGEEEGPGPDTPPVGGTGDYDVTWKETQIKVKLTNHSNSNELSSGCKRYYAGMDTTSYGDFDTAIRTRNNLAMKAANVKVTYDWIENTESGKGWGGNIQDMVLDVASGSDKAPDIYCNFAYDMTCAALRNCFANLLGENYANGNHFRFTQDDYNSNISEEDYFNSAAGEGYFYKYMESLSLTPDTQLYCLASDYTIDVMRSFLVVPVNVDLMGRISVKDSAAGDKDGDGDHDIEDFYKLVWDNGWDYSALATYSKAIAVNSNTANPKADIADERVGFALGVGSGLSSSGMLYTTSVKILNKNADGSFSYPAENPGLNAFAIALRDLFVKSESYGVCTVNKAEVQSILGREGTELEGIRQRFSTGNVLFGGVIMVGSLEDKVYQDMKSTGQGFGIVPVPLYQSAETSGDEYKTLVHNIARIMAISKASQKFSQCSAYLDYQSRNSHDILEEYYGNMLTASVGGVAGDQNAQMLIYIRNHVNDCFDKTYEDAIANYMNETDPNATSTRWHGMLMDKEYKMNSFSAVYESVLDKKQSYIKDVYEAWLKLEK